MDDGFEPIIGEGVSWLTRTAFLNCLGRLRGAERLSALRWRCDVSQDCANAQSVTIGSRPDRNTARGREWIRGRSSILLLHLQVLCRRCGPCLRRRASQWRMRCMAEGMHYPRTWFATLTVEPAWRYRFALGAHIEAKRKGVSFWHETPEDQFRWLVRHGDDGKTMGTELTHFFKRVRKSSGVPLRYCVVAEAHKSGDPHFHALVHQVAFDQPLLKRHLKGGWSVGFSDWRLVTDTRQLTYACKYLAKSSLTRVRASQGYGRQL